MKQAIAMYNYVSSSMTDDRFLVAWHCFILAFTVCVGTNIVFFLKNRGDFAFLCENDLRYKKHYIMTYKEEHKLLITIDKSQIR